MSKPTPRLPPEILDFVVDLLYPEKVTLRKCCLLSKSWVSRARKHLFAYVRFEHPADLEAWKTTFPDPASSPAYHTHSLFVGCVQAISAADAEEGGWIQTFSNVLRLEVRSGIRNIHEQTNPLVLLHNFSPRLKSLLVVSRNLSPSQVFSLSCSLPLLEDLGIVSHGMSSSYDGGTVFRPSTSPVLTGILGLYVPEGMEYTARQLLNMPNGLRFWKFNCTLCLEEDLQWIIALVTTCSDTLKCIEIDNCVPRGSLTTPVDLTRATKLKKVVFRLNSLHVQWVAMALGTITSEHRDLEQISIYIPPSLVPQGDPANIARTVGEEVYSQWVQLDRSFAKLWESHAIYVRVKYNASKEKGAARECIENLLPGVAKKGIIELVNLVESGMTK